MKKPAIICVAAASVTALTAGSLPSSAGAETNPSERVDNPDQGLNLDTPEAALQYLRSFAITDAQIESFAGGLGLTSEEYLNAVARAFSTDPVGPAPVEFVDGKIKYNNTVQASSSFSFDRTQTRVEQGTVDSVSGRCRFDDAAIGSGFGSHVVSEVVEFDPENCRRTVFDGAYDPASVDRGSELAGASVAGGVAARGAPSGPMFLPCSTLTDRPTPVFAPGSRGSAGSRHYKHSFVDPVCITITSSTLNVRWKNTPNSSNKVTLLPGTNARVFYYTDLGEEWPEAQKKVRLVPRADETVTRTREVTTSLVHGRVETDFPEHLAMVAALFGISGLTVALVFCRFDLSDTTFVSNQTLKLRRNGAWFASGSADVAGGCSSLVHDRKWHGAGWVR